MHTKQWTMCVGAFALGAVAYCQSGPREFRARLSGFQETPAVSTPATGEFRAHLSQDQSSLTYELTYSGLEGPVRMAHIHLGQRGVAGGIMIWLCETAASQSPVASTPTCPQSGTVSGTVTAADVVGPGGQGVSAGEFAEALRALRSGVGYANVHTDPFPAGEIRGQIRGEDD